MLPEQITKLETLIMSLEAGLPLSPALLRSGFVQPADVPAELAMSIKMSRELGSSLIPPVRQMLEMEKIQQQLRDEIEAEFTTPKATIRLVAWLPAVAMLLAIALGLDPTILFGSVINLISISAGAGLVWVALRWAKAIVARAQPEKSETVMQISRFSLALAAGLSWRQAMRDIDLSVQSHRILEEELALSRSTGAAVRPTVERLVDRLIQKQFEQDRIRVRLAGVQLSLPLGVALLPALIFLVVVPMFTTTAVPNWV